MYCDPSILDDSSEGSNELAVKVPVGTELRWRAVPLQTTAPGDAGVYHTIIEAYYLWDQAGTYLTEWGTSNGGGDAPFYKSTGNLANNTPATIAVEGIDRPFIQCLTQLANRDQNVSPKVAYTFYIGIYKNGDKVEQISWDPFVTVYRQ
ncbi:Inclusion body protein [Nannocystis exedens]|uniref:Inclusion body protein n=1 Tax=Nannocystis exedens TaxID=54 RepID=A0A1I2GY66_9BACT|nr:AidA/PixA family protein [Nannocystis exedens]PCC74043.1 inclusion body protein [Nannocystis exedens]SFF21536.1 Inclusion body protein [Nannocystis exedens]